jgi:hypothetical protein
MTGGRDVDVVMARARDVLRDFPPATSPRRSLLGACYDAGLGRVHFPPGLGGLAVDTGLQEMADQILQDAGRPVPSLDEETDVARMFLRFRAYTIEGGTSDIPRNFIGEWLLGLPGDPRADADRPWREVPRG